LGKLDGKVAVITGGASGIGAATVELFVNEGAKVLIADIQDEKGEELAGKLGDNGLFLHTDVSVESEIKAAVKKTVKLYGRLDCIFNNAGYGGVSGSIDSISVEGFDRTMGVLLKGVFLGIKHAVPVMKVQDSGSIINTASVAGLRTGYGHHIYSSAKAAVIHLTRSVAMELGESGIRVNCICPGGIATPIFFGGAGLTDDEMGDAVEGIKGSLSGLQPIKRSGLPEDIAKAALWLASDDSSFVTGHALVVDGGITCGRSWADWMGTVEGLGKIVDGVRKLEVS
jgi:NAD(P)-dependent dehydrogenase (short-subunit alcohol dehydrogenase family)